MESGVVHTGGTRQTPLPSPCWAAAWRTHFRVFLRGWEEEVLVDGGNELEETDLLPLLGADSLLANPPSARGKPRSLASIAHRFTARRVSQFDLCRRVNELTKENSLYKT